MDGTERERANARAANRNCRPCHQKFDPLGLTFERYDAIGRYNETRQAVLDSDTSVTCWQTDHRPVDASAGADRRRPGRQPGRTRSTA